MAKKKSEEASSGEEVKAEAADQPAEQAKPEKKEKQKKPKAEKSEGSAAPFAPVTASEQTSKKKKRPGKSPARGKKLRNHIKNQRQKISKEGAKSLPQAIDLLKKLKKSKSDETVEVHMSLGVDVTQADQMLRGTVSLPHGIGKSVRVVVFTQGDNVAKAQEAGADHVGGDDLIQKIQKENWLDFDVALATQDMMGKVSRLGKVLGPRGLMPTPKAGTVITSDVAQVVKEFKAGKVEYRTDKSGNVHAGVGKMSFPVEKLVENAQVFVDQIKSVKPSSAKGQYIKTVFISATQSRGIPVSV